MKNENGGPVSLPIKLRHGAAYQLDPDIRDASARQLANNDEFISATRVYTRRINARVREKMKKQKKLHNREGSFSRREKRRTVERTWAIA